MSKKYIEEIETSSDAINPAHNMATAIQWTTLAVCFGLLMTAPDFISSCLEFFLATRI